jgi:hypothetical protein
MKNSLLAALVAAAGLAALTGCGGGMIPFTHELRTEHHLTDADVKNLQFYVSHKVTLRRELDSGSKQVTGNHKLLLVSGKTIEEVVVEEKTPGVALQVNGSAISVSFEPGSSMTFAVNGEDGSPPPAPVVAFAQPPDPFPGNKTPQDDAPQPFPGLKSEPSGSYWLFADGGNMKYGNKVFAAVGDSLKAHLLIDADTLNQVVEERKVLPGMRLSTK